MPKPTKKHVPWGDHVLRGKPGRTTATPMTTPKAPVTGGLSRIPTEKTA